MSGSSLDGLDLAFCSFQKEGENVNWSLDGTLAIPYPNSLRRRLGNPDSLDEAGLNKLDHDFGIFVANSLISWIGETGFQVDLIASHGHTLFHRPEKGLTLQVGDGKVIYESTGIKVVNDFRSGDVKLGGQGAPLVPAGDHDLFPGFDAYLNLGGITNISFFDQGDFNEAFDIGPFNQVVNHYSRLLGSDFDHGGEFGSKGHVEQMILEKWNSLNYYKQPGPKSLGREWVEEIFLPSTGGVDPYSSIATFYQHMAEQIQNVLSKKKEKGRVLVTGGGAKNHYFLDLLKGKSEWDFIVPEQRVIDFKEAIIFAYLGFLRVRGERNIFAAATGASKDSIGGIIHGK